MALTSAADWLLALAALVPALTGTLTTLTSLVACPVLLLASTSV